MHTKRTEHLRVRLGHVGAGGLDRLDHLRQHRNQLLQGLLCVMYKDVYV